MIDNVRIDSVIPFILKTELPIRRKVIDKKVRNDSFIPFILKMELPILRKEEDIK